MDDYLTTVSETTLLKGNQPGLQPLREELLTTALGYYEAFLEQQSDDPEIQEATANAHWRVGSISWQLKNTEKAMAAFQTASKLFEELHRASPENTDLTIQWTRAIQSIGQLELSEGKVAESLEHFTEVLRIREDLVARVPASEDLQVALADACQWVSSANRELGQPEQATDFAKRSVQILEPIINRSPDRKNYLSKFSDTLMTLATAMRNAGHEDANATVERAIDVQRKVVERDPADTHNSRKLADLLFNFGNHIYGTGDPEGAAQSYLASVHLLQPIAANNPAVVDYQLGLAGTYMMLGHSQTDAGQLSEALRHAELARTMLESLREQGHADTRILRDLAGAHAAIARLQEMDNRIEDARASLRIVIATLNQLNSTDPIILFNLGTTQAKCGQLLDQQGDLTAEQEAERDQLLDEAVATLRRSVDAGWRNVDAFKINDEFRILSDRQDYRELLQDIERAP